MLDKRKQPHTEEHKRKIALAHLGMKYPPEFGEKQSQLKKGKHLSPATEFKKGQVSIRKGKKQPQTKEQYEKRVKTIPRGENHYNWKGGINPINDSIRKSLQYKLWRKAVLQRDNFTCQKTGQKGGKLVAHHINNFSSFEELRFAIDNGITLSKEAHKKFHHIYGIKNNTLEQLKEYLVGSQ